MTVYTELIAELENEQEDWVQEWIAEFVSYLFRLESANCKGETRLRMLTDQGEEETHRVWAQYVLERGESCET